MKIPFKKHNLIFWSIFAIPFLTVFLIFFLAANGKLGYMPRVEDLENPEINLASLIISEDHEVLGTVYIQNQNRTHVPYDKLPKHLVDALIATEDIRFHKHSGIDFKGTARAVIKTGILGQNQGGGSTITQQLAKLLFHEPPKTVIERLKQKVKEYVIASKLERSYTKEEIISLYFNQYDFLYNAVGIHTASQTYFGKTPDSLNVQEAAVLVGMAKNPFIFNPKIKPEKSLHRRNVVLSQMEKYGYLSAEASDSLQQLPIELRFQKISHNYGLATYFRGVIQRTLTRPEPNRKKYKNYKSYQEDSTKWAKDPLYGWCNKNRKPNGEPYNVFTDGLRIYTTVNSKMQHYAEEAVQAHMGGYLQDAFFREQKGRTLAPFSDDLEKRQIDAIIRNAIRYSDRGVRLYNRGVSMDSIYANFKVPVEMTVFTWQGEKDTVMSPLDSILYYKHFLRTGFMSMDPSNGHVKAYVGGINYKYFKYDHVTQGKRQAGSTFKPFLYILAMQEGYSPCDKELVQSITFQVNDTTWTPKTTGRPEHIGTYKTYKWGLATSENYISARLVYHFKPQPIADIAYKMGIESYIDPVPSMIYGPSDMSVSEMVGSYATFANKGVHVKPMMVTRIEDKYGNVLADFMPETKESISEETSYLMLNLLQGVTEYGTAVRLRYKYGFTGEIAGKTGTTNNHSDGWFIGVTPKLVSGGWVGGEERSIRFRSLGMGSGTSMALPIWAEYMQRVYADSTLGITEEDVFEAPDYFDYNLDCNSVQSSDEEEDGVEVDYEGTFTQ